jgi:hypothetical protein
MPEDKRTIGLTEANERIVEQLVDTGFFRHQMDAAKLALSVAINSGVKPGAVEGATTIWNVGSFDDDGQLRNLIPLLFPGIDTPYRAVEHLINDGLRIIGQKLASRPDLDLIELMDMDLESQE